MAAVPQLLSAGVGRLSRSASGVLFKAATGFHVLHVDGYSWTKTLAGGVRISSDEFFIGGQYWFIDYYPNGADSGKDYDYISVQLRLRSGSGWGEYHKQAQYKFRMLDAAGNDAYELITREELERRSETLLRDDCLAIRCDVGVAQKQTLAIAPKQLGVHWHPRPQSAGAV